MMFAFFSPVFMLFPLILIFMAVRVASRFIRGGERRRSLMDDAFEVPPHQSAAPQITQDSPHEARIFKLAYRLKGRITVSDVVVDTGLGIHESESVLESMVDNTHVRMEVDTTTGVVSYEFPEILSRVSEEEAAARAAAKAAAADAAGDQGTGAAE